MNTSATTLLHESRSPLAVSGKRMSLIGMIFAFNVVFSIVTQSVAQLQCYVCGQLARQAYKHIQDQIPATCNTYPSVYDPLWLCEKGVKCAQKTFNNQVIARVCASEHICDQYAGGTQTACKWHEHDGTVFCCCDRTGCNGHFLPAMVWPKCSNSTDTDLSERSTQQQQQQQKQQHLPPPNMKHQTKPLHNFGDHVKPPLARFTPHDNKQQQQQQQHTLNDQPQQQQQVVKHQPAPTNDSNISTGPSASLSCLTTLFTSVLIVVL